MPKTYTTVQGDTWDIISLKLFNTEKLMHKLVEANYQYNTYVIFPTNITLDIPDIDIQQDTASLPPWRKK